MDVDMPPTLMWSYHSGGDLKEKQEREILFSCLPTLPLEASQWGCGVSDWAIYWCGRSGILWQDQPFATQKVWSWVRVTLIRNYIGFWFQFRSTCLILLTRAFLLKIVSQSTDRWGEGPPLEQQSWKSMRELWTWTTGGESSKIGAEECQICPWGNYTLICWDHWRVVPPSRGSCKSFELAYFNLCLAIHIYIESYILLQAFQNRLLQLEKEKDRGALLLLLRAKILRIDFKTNPAINQINVSKNCRERCSHDRHFIDILVAAQGVLWTVFMSFQN